MKTTPYLIATSVGIVLMSAAPNVQSTKPVVDFTEQNLVFPDDVMAIIENKCMGCHKPDARNEKAREKLQWAQLADMPVDDLIAKLDVLMEVLEEGAMPPAKMLEKYPEQKLTDNEVATLKNWTSDNLDRLIGD